MSRDNKILMLALFLWGAGEGLFIYVQPIYLGELGADPVAIGAALSFASAAAAASHIPAGWLADHLGRRGVMIAGWALGALACLAMYLATDLWLFVAGAVTYAFTLFVVGPLSAYAAQARGAQSAQRAITLAYAGFWAGTIVSPAAGGWLGEVFGLRIVFGVAAVIIGLATVTVLFVRPQPVTHVAAGETRYGALFAHRRYRLLLGLVFLALIGIYLGLPLMPKFLQEVRGYNLSLIGWLGTINSVGGVLANGLLGQSPPRRGFLMGQIAILLAMVLLLTTSLPAWMALAYLFRAGWNLVHSMSIAQVNQLVTPAQTGLAFGLMETSISAAQIVAPLLAGQLYAMNTALPFQASLGLVVVTLPLVWWGFAPPKEPVKNDA